MKTYDWAKRYIDIGWSIIPISAETKIPAIKEVIPYRSRFATDEELHTWFDNGDNGIAVITGKQSGIIVLDDDSMKKTGVPSSLVSKVKSSVMSNTAGGGRHYFLKYEEGFGNRINIAGAQVDIKSEGGYALLPPTRRGKGIYSWISPPSKENLGKLPRLSSTPEVVGELQKLKPANVNMQDYLFVGSGQRNDSLFRLACGLFRRLTKPQAVDLIVSINKNYSPPLPDHEVEIIITQAYRYYQRDKKIGTVASRSLDELVRDRMIEREYEKMAPSTGFRNLDRHIVGFVPGRLYTLTGDTNVGKTTIAANFAVNVARKGHSVLYIALESGNAIIETFTSIYFNKEYADITEEDLMKFSRANPNLTVFVDRDIVTPQDLIRNLREYEGRYDLVIIDHIGYFVTDKQNYLMEQANILKELRFLTKEKKMAIMVIAHLRKKAKGESKKAQPTMDDISGSGAFKQDSTDVLIVVREKDDFETSGMKLAPTGYLYITKTKATKGGVGALPLTFFDTDFEHKKATISEIDTVHKLDEQGPSTPTQLPYKD